MTIDCLIINLTRFGDLIQSQALLHDLHAHGLKTGLVAQENFAKTISLLDHVDACFVLKGASLLKSSDDNWKNACKELHEWAKSIQKENQVSHVLNLTATLPARLLARLLSPAKKPILGFGLDEEGFGVNFGPWATFLSGTSSCRHNAVFNIADMFRMMAEPLYTSKTPYPISIALQRPGASDLNNAHNLLDCLERPSSSKQVNGFIAFQLGASAAKRQWPTRYFARLGDTLWEECGLCPVLTGAKNEEILGAEFIEESHSPYVNAIGRTSLPVLSALLCHMKLLVSNDTGTLHLASGLGTPSLSFFLATAQPWDTGPSLPHCLCLEPDIPCHPCSFKTECPYDHRCLQTIKPDQITPILRAWFHGATWQKAVQTVPNLTARAWETARGDDGFVTIIPHTHHANEDRTRWIQHQRLFWRQLLDELSTNQRLPSHKPTPIAPCSDAFLNELTQVLEPCLHLLTIITEQAGLLEKSSQAGTLFLRNCDRLQTLLSTNSLLTSLAYFWRELRTDHGQNLESLFHAITILSKHIAALLDHAKNGTNYA
ncbi:MAG: glycosyltransferase family 9 protein [Desulfovibrio sp.]|nr:glycosyltransferase family 9 protein [Desulfovibrio sp.]